MPHPTLFMSVLFGVIPRGYDASLGFTPRGIQNLTWLTEDTEVETATRSPI